MEEKARPHNNTCRSRAAGREQREALGLLAGWHSGRVGNGLGGLLCNSPFGLVKQAAMLQADGWRNASLDPVGNALGCVPLRKIKLSRHGGGTAEKLDEIGVWVLGVCRHGA